MNTMDLKDAAAEKYVNAIRNHEKKAYARRYKSFRQGDDLEPVDGEYRLSTMARQAVRLQLDAILSR